MPPCEKEPFTRYHQQNGKYHDKPDVDNGSKQKNEDYQGEMEHHCYRDQEDRDQMMVLLFGIIRRAA